MAYHLRADVRAFCARLAALKTAGGLPFSALAATIAGGVLPELARTLNDGPRRTLAGRRGEIAFNLAFFALNGVVIDRLYRGLGLLFGADADVATVAMKVACDQFVFTPAWLAVIIFLYLWRSRGFSVPAALGALRVPGFYRTRVVPLLLPCWCFWIPMVSIIYALPGPLQFLMFVLALAAWSLIMVSVANRSAEAA